MPDLEEGGVDLGVREFMPLSAANAMRATTGGVRVLYPPTFTQTRIFA
jgi:hypothetical protein